jgi:hypothetical protein
MKKDSNPNQNVFDKKPSWVLPEVAVRQLLDLGIKELRKDEKAFYDLFSQFTQYELNVEYGADYVKQIWEWFSTTKIPVIQAWSFNAQRIPCISVHLANETEDESKAAMGDLLGTGHNAETGIAVFTVMVDVGIHMSRGGDQVLWVYYIVSYILFKYKLNFERLGLKLHTFSASDYAKDADKMGASGNNIWTRWVRFRCTTQNFWDAQPLRKFEHVNTDPSIGGPPSIDIATSLDVNPEWVDRTANKGLVNESPTTQSGTYNRNIDDGDPGGFFDPDEDFNT